MSSSKPSLVLLLTCSCSSVLGFKSYSNDRPDAGGAGAFDAAAWDANPNDLTLASILVEAPSTTDCTTTCPAGLTCDTTIGKCVVETTIRPVAGTLTYTVPSGIGVTGFDVIGYPAAQANDILINGTAERKPPGASMYFPTSVTTGCTGSFTVQVQNPTTSDVGDLYTIANDCGAGISQEAYVKETGASTNWGMGAAVAIDGDTLVSAEFMDGTDSAGSLFVYVRDPATRTWSFQAKLRAVTSTPFSGLGFSLAISGDTIVACNPYSYSNAGEAYVFVRDSTGAWTQQAHLVASNSDTDDQFGSTVAISGDLLVVGAGGEDSNATGINGNQLDNSANASGAAYVFARSGQTWTQTAYLKGSDSAAGYYFGFTVAAAGSTIAVGATGVPDASIPTFADGAIYVFHQDAGGAWSQSAKLMAGTGRLGVSVAVSEDESRIVAGAGGTNGVGEAYVFSDAGGSWNLESSLAPQITTANGLFGGSVSISGTTAVVGEQGEGSSAKGINGDFTDTSAVTAGAAWLFTLDGATWSERAYIKASNTNAHDAFGQWVDISGDTVVVGAPGEASSATGVNGDQSDNSTPNAGAVYVFQ
jgi:hypothetical protein